nr:protein bic1 [Quercus suber]
MEEQQSKSMAQRFSRKPSCRIPSFSSEPNKTTAMGPENSVKTIHYIALHGSSLALAPVEHNLDSIAEPEAILQRESGRERLKRHREEVAGRVLIPDTWGQEGLLKDWIDYSSFDNLLAPNGIMSARESLISQGGRGSSQRMRIEGRC